MKEVGTSTTGTDKEGETKGEGGADKMGGVCTSAELTTVGER